MPQFSFDLLSYTYYELRHISYLELTIFMGSSLLLHCFPYLFSVMEEVGNVQKSWKPQGIYFLHVKFGQQRKSGSEEDGRLTIPVNSIAHLIVSCLRLVAISQSYMAPKKHFTVVCTNFFLNSEIIKGLWLLQGPEWIPGK